MKMCETGVKVEFEKKAFEQIRQNASQVLNSDDAPDVMEYNKGNATSGLLASQGLLTNLNDYVSEYGWDKNITDSLDDTGKYDEQCKMGSGDWYGITTGAVKKGHSYNRQFNQQAAHIDFGFGRLVPCRPEPPLPQGAQQQ